MVAEGGELLSWALSTVCLWMVLAAGDAGLGFSKDRRPQPCESLKRSCCHAWTQETDVYAPAQDRSPLFLAGEAQFTSPSCKRKSQHASQSGVQVLPPRGLCSHAHALLLQCWCESSDLSTDVWR